MLSLALNVAVFTNRTLVPVDEDSWWLVKQAECGRAGFSCFFEDFTHCSVTAAERAAAIPLLQLGGAAFASAGGPANILFDWEGQTAAIKIGLLRHFVPRFPGQIRLWGNAWWRGQLLRFLMRPRERMVRELEASKRKMRWQEPVVGLHVRHGDKLKEANRLSAHDYLRVLLPVAQAHGARTLFVSTDSPDVIAELEGAAPLYSSWLRLVYEEDEIRGTDITNANLQNNLRMNVTRYTSEAARGVLLLANTSLLFCTFSSNFGRLAYELLITNQPVGGSRPDAAAAVSLDLPWFAYP